MNAMSPWRWLPAVFALTAVASADVTTRPAVASDEAAALITKLADRDSVVRRDAVFRLRRLGYKADAALRGALHDPRPAVADMAAELAIRVGRWDEPGDARSVQLILMAYANADPAARANVLTGMVINAKLPDFRRVALRTLTRDPSPLVAWLTFNEVQPDADWEKAIAAFERESPSATLPAAVTVFRARCQEVAGDEDKAAALAGVALDAERVRPTATGELLGWAFQTVIAADMAAGRYADAAGRLRDQIIRAGEEEERVSLLDRVLDLHIRHGPLPALSADLRDADDVADGHAATSLALMADRVGLPLVGGALLGAALHETPDENDGDRTARLYEAAETLQAAGYFDAACRVFDRVTAATTEAAGGRVTFAYVRMSEMHLRAGRPALAADCLQRAINRQDGPLSITLNGRPEPWTVEEQQASVYWYYLLDARYRRDAEAVRKFARLTLDSGSTNGGIFLDVAQDLPAVAKPAEIEQYFGRTFERARTRLLDSPDEPVLNNDVAWLCARTGRRLDEAVKWAERAVELKPDEAAYLDTLAETRFRSGRVKEAIELEERALLLQPEDEVFMTAQLARFRAAATQPSR